MAASDLKPLYTLYEMSADNTESMDFLCGVEYEIENVHHVDDDFFNANVNRKFIVEEDPSLRNFGVEYITFPMSYEKQLKFFDDLHNNIVWRNNHVDPYSERTSTHVHVNFKPLIMNKIAQFVKLYTLFEPHFFSLVHPSRKDNIYCVPLYYTFLPRMYGTNITYQLQKWHKYTAFNLLPLSRKGTIEFRHLQGTGDKDVFKTWLTTIKNLYDFNLTYNLDLNKILRDDNSIVGLFKDVFGADKNINIGEINDSIIDVKLSLQKNSEATMVSALNKHLQSSGK